MWGNRERRRRARVVFPLEEQPERPRMAEVDIWVVGRGFREVGWEVVGTGLMRLKLG